MRIKLIKPEELSLSSVTSAETFKIQQLSLPLLAAHTPAGHKVKIVDESFARDNADEDVDLLGITVMTDLALRAYQIADDYRRRSIPVVMGGIHATALPDEALEHADAVVIGEGEEVWQQIVTDAANGHMKRIYRANRGINLAGRPLPRYDLYPRPSLKGYIPTAVGIEASRGCPYDCEFCSIGLVMGHKYRVRPVHEVISEIESISIPNLMFVDDNLALNRRAAKELFTEMIPLKRKWVGQGPVSLAEDLELLSLMRRSGCEALLIGFESVQVKTQSIMLKIKHLKLDYAEAMRRFHGEGIAVLGAFVFGFDHENKDVFDQTLEFAYKHCVELASLRALIPFPGTKLYFRLLKEGRLLVPDWWLKNDKPKDPLFRPMGMTIEEFANGLGRISREFYSVSSILRRSFGVSPWKRSAAGWQLYAGANLNFRKRYYKEFES